VANVLKKMIFISLLIKKIEVGEQAEIARREVIG